MWFNNGYFMKYLPKNLEHSIIKNKYECKI